MRYQFFWDVMQHHIPEELFYVLYGEGSVITQMGTSNSCYPLPDLI